MTPAAPGSRGEAEVSTAAASPSAPLPASLTPVQVPVPRALPRKLPSCKFPSQHPFPSQHLLPGNLTPLPLTGRGAVAGTQCVHC